MFVLSEQQVSFILDDIRRNGIEREELQLDLLDHICCVIENEKKPGQDFEDFYRTIIPRFFKRRLGEIQEETDLLLTFKHYYAMKKIMLISGAFAAIGIVIGSLFKVMHWPGAAPVFLLSVFTLSFIFLPILFLLKSKELKLKREKVTLGIATIFGIIVSLAILFKVMHWPGANVMGTVSLITLIFIFLPIYFFGGIKNPETKTNTIVSSVLILFAGGLIFLLTNLRSSNQIHFLYATTIRETHSSYEFITKQNELKYTSAANDSTKSQADLLQLKNACSSVCAKIEAAKKEMIDIASSGQDPDPDFETIVSQNAGNYDLPTHMLFDHNGEPTERLAGIKADIEKLKILLESEFHREVFSILNTNDIEDSGKSSNEKISWEKAKFFHVPFELVMMNFNQLELDVRMLESACL